MSGSRSWYQYRTNDGRNYAVEMDDTAAGIVGNPPALAGTPSRPILLSPRFVTYASQDNLTRRRITLSFQTTGYVRPASYTVQTDAGPVVLFDKGVTPERERLSTVNTGLQV
jgi:hypothetical protein